MTAYDFSAAVQRFVATFGIAPPGSVYEFHPAHHDLSDAIRQATWIRFKGARPFHRMWAAEAACHMLRDLVLVDGKLTECGVTAEQLRSDITRWGPPLTPHHCTRSLTLLVIDLLADSEPTIDGPLRRAWRGIRQCPPPSMECYRGRLAW